MHTFVIVMLVIATASFAAELIGVPARINWIALGLLAWVLSVLIPALQ